MSLEKHYSAEQIEKNKSILSEFWQGNIKTVFSSYSYKFEYRQLENADEMIANAILNLEDAGTLPGINIPRFLIDFGTVSTASFWGGRIFKPDGGRVWIDPIIHKDSDLEGITPINPELGDNLKAQQLWGTVQKKLNYDWLSCSAFDIQGPLNTLALMWEQQDFMMTMYDNPEIIHKALDMVTEHLIKVIRTLIEKIPSVEAPLWPYIWLPTEIGIGITEDYMPLLSPELYLEFGIPYVKRISDEFGGLFIHCCGQFSQHIDNLAKSGINIIGMEFVYPNIDIKKLFDTFRGTAVFVPNLMDKSIGDFGTVTEYFKYVNGLRTADTRLWYILRPDQADFEEQAKYLESITDEI